MVHISRWQSILILTVCLVGILLLTPSFISQRTLNTLPDWFPKAQVSLGLDLQGGSHLLLEVDTKAIIDEDLNSMVESARTALRQAQVGYRNLGVRAGAVTFDLVDPVDAQKARDSLKDLRTGNTLDVDGSLVTLKPTEQSILDRQRSAVEQSIEIVRRRIDESGTREPNIQRQGRDRIVVQLPGINDPERIKRLLGKTAKMTFHLVDQNTPRVPVGTPAPPGSMVLPPDKADPAEGGFNYVVRKRVEVAGDRLVDAQPTFQNNEAVVNFRFDSVGAKKFADITRQHVGEPFAIVLDDKVISAPVIREPILGGSGVISGSFTPESAKDLAVLLRAGALPAPLLVLEERTVGPSLGADSINAGLLAGYVSLALVCAYMAVSYGLFGMMANVAVIVNLILVGACLSVLQASLTLPGIAGLVLTIGMSVDANVLIFERIREETRNGRTPVAAVDAGFRRAFGTIIDSNLTTLFPAMLMFGMGSGPIKGFAVTISLGIITSMFTSVMLTRQFVILWLRHWRPKTIPI
jgi:preprotein translocase subunit SecD